LIAGAALFLWRMPGALPRASDFIPDNFSQAEWSKARAGDLLFRRGPGLASSLIVSYLHDGTGLSHGAMLLKDKKTGEWRVLQSINGSFNGTDGVQEQRLSDFMGGNLPGSLVLIRPRWPESVRDRIVARASSLLDHPPPFDNNYDFSDRRALYCTELLWVLVAENGWPAEGLKPVLSGSLLSFWSFLDPAWFRVVLSHNAAIPVTAD
jgi:hypothetical protein